MDESRATIDSLGNWALANVSGAREIRITADEGSGTAKLVICLAHDSWPARERAIEAMVDVRETFFDDLAISYSFGSTSQESLTASERASSLLFA